MAWFRDMVEKRPFTGDASLNHLSTVVMLHDAVVFLIIAIIAAVLGFGSLSGLAATIAQVCFVVFLIVALVSFLKKKA